MDIERMILTDGEILEYSAGPDSLTIKFVDYCGYSYELLFTGNVEFVDNDGVGYDINNSKIRKDGDRRTLELFDDDRVCLFRVEYERAVVTELE